MKSIRRMGALLWCAVLLLGGLARPPHHKRRQAARSQPRPALPGQVKGKPASVQSTEAGFRFSPWAGA